MTDDVILIVVGDEPWPLEWVGKPAEPTPDVISIDEATKWGDVEEDPA